MVTAMYLPLYTLAYLYAFWLVYIVVMGAYRAHIAKRLSLVATVLLAPVIAVGVVMDVATNLVIAPLIFLERPHEWLVTSRLIRYLNTDSGWRKAMAKALCSNLLDIFDPNGVHCQ